MLSDQVADRCVSEADFAASPLFVGLDPAFLVDCARRADHVAFPRGSVLARQDDHAEAFYILIEGRVEVVIEHDGEPDRFIDVLGPGECIGDLALLLNQVRTATVRAIRPCRAARFDAEGFAWLIRTSPDFTVRLARTLGSRLKRATYGPNQLRPVERIAVLPASDGAPVAAFLGALTEALAAEARRAGRRPPTGRHVPVRGIDDLDAVTLNTLQEADAILFVAEASAEPDTARLRALLDWIAEFRPAPRVELVLLQRTAPPYRGTLARLHARSFAAWHHIGAGRDADIARLARRITNRAIGLVLSGGGARGFAHIGVLRAFAEARVPIDFIAGSSMGAIVAAQHAIGCDVPAMMAHMRRSYVQRRTIRDYAIPFIALHTGTATTAELKAMFGETRIEDLPTPYFAVSSNLSTAETVVHTTGKLWHAARCSSSVPGLLPPVRSRRGLLVDGGLLDNLPVGAMRERCRGRIVASDVSVAVDFQRPAGPPPRRRGLAALRPSARFPGIRQILMRTMQLASVRDARNAGVPADLYLRPPVDDVGMSEFHRLDDLVERGAAHAALQLAGWTR